MANAALNTDNATPLIEEQVETGLRELLAEYRPTYTLGGAVSDELEGRYSIHTNKPLPQFTHSFAGAFEVSDKTMPTRAMYAMVCNPELPYRTQTLADAQNFNHPHFHVPVTSGTVKCSHVNESRFVILFERPQGTPLSQVIGNQTRMHETKVLSTILEPACNALMAMRERKIHHGNIRPESFFLGDTPMLGECFSAAPGTIGHHLYESLERIMADPMGHGEADEKSDIYALAVLAFDAMYGLDRLKNISRDEFITRALRQGSYNVFANNRDFPPAIQDFFRGALTDNIAERWTLDQLAQFIGGKRFNMIVPTAPKDAARPFVFMEESILSRRLLAHMLHRNWREALKDIRGLNLDRWCETSLHRPELAENIERALRIGSDRAASDRQISDMMTRIITTLDPVGPLRSKSLSLRPDGISLMLACLAGTQEPELEQLLGFIESDLSSFWSEQSQSTKNPNLSQVIWRLQRVKPYLKNRSLGFGLERALYEMNPTLPCQSPLLKQYHITTVEDALSSLDALAKTRSDHSLIDRHLAAFIAAKLDMSKPVKLSELTNLLGLQTNPELLMLRILSKAQQKHTGLKLVGLSAWAGLHVERMMSEIHNRALRKQQKLKLKRRAATGQINEVLMTVLNRDIGDQDTDGFVHAMAQHEINYKRIQHLKNPLLIEYKSRKTGGQMATIISYTALTLMIFHIITNMVGG